MLWFVLFKYSIAFLFASFAGYVSYISWSNYVAKEKFKRKMPIVPFVPGGSLLGGHSNTITLDPRNWMKIEEYHKKYGNTFAAMFRDKLMISTLDLKLIKKFIIDQPNEHNTKLNPQYPVDEMCQDSILFGADLKQWQRLRKSMAPSFSLHRVKSAFVQSEIQNCINKVIDTIDWKLNSVAKKANYENYIEIDVDDLFHRYALDLVFTCFLKQPDLIDYRADRDFWASAMDKFGRDFNSRLFRVCMLFPIILPIINWFLFRFHPSGVYRKYLYKYVSEHIEMNEKAMRESGISGERDFENVESFTNSDGSKFKRGLVDYFMDRYFKGNITRREYIHSTIGLLFAADKSTADTLAKLIYNLSLNERVQSKLRNLVLTREEGEEFEYLNWVIYESMRVITPVYIGCSRLINNDIESDVGVIPKGTFVYTPNYLIHKLEQYWGKDAQEFIPERWAESKNFHPLQYLAFGAGKRNCLGYMFAMAELRMVLCQLIKVYKFEISPKTDPRLMHTSPSLVFTIYDKPTYVRISRVST